VLTLSQVRAVLTEQSRAQLIETSQAYALTVYERLLMAQGSLARIAMGLHDGAARRPALQTLEGMYSALSVVGRMRDPRRSWAKPCVAGDRRRPAALTWRRASRS